MVFAPVSGLGDVITVAKFIKDLVKTLDEAKGSVAEYRFLR